jgi:hypothetical protein
MKGKKRTNPLREYRRLQREIREIFDPFTAKYCPSCKTPCCIKPTKVTPVDVAMAEGIGHTFDRLAIADPYAVAFDDAEHRLASTPLDLPVMGGDDGRLIPCEFLDKGRCAFPDDLRPFGCAAYLCAVMYENLPEEAIKRLRRLIRQLETARVGVLKAIS